MSLVAEFAAMSAAQRIALANRLYQGNIHRVTLPTDIWNTNGYFGTIRVLPNKQWTCANFYSCREDFHRVNRLIQRMLLIHAVDAGPNIAAFLRIAETKLHTQPFSIVGATSRTNTSWIEISPWWREQAMRRSFFTALIRAAWRYDPATDNFDQALFSYHYMANTRRAVTRFMEGYTRYTGRVCGWVNQFYRFEPSSWTHLPGNRPRLEELLVRP